MMIRSVHSLIPFALLSAFGATGESPLPDRSGSLASPDPNDVAALVEPVTPEVRSHGSLKLVTMNVGTAAVIFQGDQVHPNCPHYKLCEPKLTERLRDFFASVNPDVAFIQETLGPDQLVGTAFGGPIFFEREVQCTTGNKGVNEVCLVWNPRRLALIGQCARYSQPDGGVISCPLTDLQSGETIQFVSAHPSAWRSRERADVARALWLKVVDRKMPAVVGADFNTETETSGVERSIPAPAEFGTIVGRHVRHFGRWNSESTYYGSSTLHRASSTAYGLKIDHLFANFGKPIYGQLSCDDQDHCWSYPGFQSGRELGWPMDHKPIVSVLAW